MLRRRAVLGTQKCEKSVGRRGCAPDPAGGAYSAPPDPIAGGEGSEGALLPPPQEPHLQYCHCACPVCMYTRFLFKRQRNTFLLAAYCYSWNCWRLFLLIKNVGKIKKR